jgi:hypothetical protein
MTKSSTQPHDMPCRQEMIIPTPNVLIAGDRNRIIGANPVDPSNLGIRCQGGHPQATPALLPSR